MSAHDMLTAYERLMNELYTAVSAEDWKRLEETQDEIESLQQRFDALPDTVKQQPDVQNKLRLILQKQTELTERVSHAKQKAARNIRKLKSAKTQQQGYLNRAHTTVPPVLYDRKE